MQTITSLQNQHVKDAAKLRERREREKQGRLLIDGARELGRALAAGIEVLDVFVCESLCRSDEAKLALGLIGPSRARVLAVTPPVFAKLAYGDRAEGVVGVAKMPRRSLGDLRLPERALVAIVEGIEKPGNLGAILRSADAAGVSALIATGRGTDLYNPNVIRSSLGTVFTLPVVAAGVDDALQFVREQRLPVFAARVDAALLYTAAPLGESAAIVLGSETDGLSEAWQADDVRPIKLPMLGVADSLNVSAAAAVLFYEALRQRGMRGTATGDARR
ncbi:MAG TPA: TrmH family RNA methyltransferase [Pirellulales bacterium]|nr:TrmH family RNA methyltransferase [Pirellulales bacterium]